MRTGRESSETVSVLAKTAETYFAKFFRSFRTTRGNEQVAEWERGDVRIQFLILCDTNTRCGFVAGELKRWGCWALSFFRVLLREGRDVSSEAGDHLHSPRARRHEERVEAAALGVHAEQDRSSEKRCRQTERNRDRNQPRFLRSRYPPMNAMSMARPMIEVVFQPRAAPLLVILAPACPGAIKPVARFGAADSCTSRNKTLLLFAMQNQVSIPTFQLPSSWPTDSC